MLIKEKKVTEDDFYDKYRPIKNHLDPDAGWDGCLYETFSDELEYCFELSKKENRVWTILECDDIEHEADDELDDIFDENQDDDYEPTCFVIVSGFHYVNRIGFFVTEIPYEDNEDIYIKLT